MGNAHGCEIPEDLYYDVENNVWARREAEGTLVVGMTSYACSLSGSIVAYTPKKPGKEVKQGKSCATVESGKWVGPVKAPVGGEVVAVNEALSAKPSLINEDPYGQGWLVKLRPTNWDSEAGVLKTGAEAVAAFAAKMDADGFGGC